MLYSKSKLILTTISSKGQATVPAELRELLGLTPGTKIAFEAGPQGTLIARKAAGGNFFAKFQGSGKQVGMPYRESTQAMDGGAGSSEAASTF